VGLVSSTAYTRHTLGELGEELPENCNAFSTAGASQLNMAFRAPDSEEDKRVKLNFLSFADSNGVDMAGLSSNGSGPKDCLDPAALAARGNQSAGAGDGPGNPQDVNASGASASGSEAAGAKAEDGNGKKDNFESVTEVLKQRAKMRREVIAVDQSLAAALADAQKAEHISNAASGDEQLMEMYAPFLAVLLSRRDFVLRVLENKPYTVEVDLKGFNAYLKQVLDDNVNPETQEEKKGVDFSKRLPVPLADFKKIAPIRIVRQSVEDWGDDVNSKDQLKTSYTSWQLGVLKPLNSLAQYLKKACSSITATATVQAQNEKKKQAAAQSIALKALEETAGGQQGGTEDNKDKKAKKAPLVLPSSSTRVQLGHWGVHVSQFCNMPEQLSWDCPIVIPGATEVEAAVQEKCRLSLVCYKATFLKSQGLEARREHLQLRDGADVRPLLLKSFAPETKRVGEGNAEFSSVQLFGYSKGLTTCTTEVHSAGSVRFLNEGGHFSLCLVNIIYMVTRSGLACCVELLLQVRSSGDQSLALS
jgi:hypothetical protein